MNEPACRAYTGAQYLPSYTVALTLNSTLTLTLLLQAPCTLNYRRAARHTNRLRSPFCTKTRSSTAHQQQVHNKSYKWRVGFNVNGRRILPNDAVHRTGRPPHPATWASLPDTGAWTVSRNCPIAQVRYTLYTNSPVRFLLIHYRKPSCRPGYLRLHLVGVSFCKHVTCLQRKHC